MANAETAANLNAALRPLVEQAFARHGSSCLGNMPFPTSTVGVAAAARALKSNGGMDAWRLALRLEEPLEHTAS